jgi:hypothetical protein
LTIISGILSASAGVVWFMREKKQNSASYDSVTSEA